MNHPLGLPSYPHASKASETSIRSPSSSLHSWTTVQQQLSNTGRKPLFPTFFFFLEQNPCCPAAYKQFHGSLLGAASSLFHPRENRSSPYQSNLRGRYFLWHSLFSNWEEPNQRGSLLRSLEHHFNNASHDNVLGLFVFCWLAPSLINSWYFLI